MCTDRAVDPRGAHQMLEKNSRVVRSALTNSTSLPRLELPEKLILFLLGHWRPAGRLLALVDEARENTLEILEIGRGSHRCIALQPLLGRRKAPPAGKLGHNVDLVPFGMMAGIEQQLEPGEERIDEIHQIAVTLGAILEVGGREHGTD